MRAVAFYSNTGQSRAVAEYLSDRLGFPLIEAEATDGGDFEDLILVFPVHCQRIPLAVSRFLGSISVKNLTAVATYGRMGYGNVLYEIRKKYAVSIVAAAYIPAKHAYIENDAPLASLDCLEPVVEKIKAPSPILLPRLYKNPFADILPALRSRLGLKLYATDECDGCGACSAACPLGATRSGRAGSRCIRCLRCASACPRGALKTKARLPLRLYLRKKRETRTVIYV